MAGQGFDLVILGGRVMDPAAGLDAVRNIGVTDGKIAETTTDAISGKETVDATGQVVAPGFMDCHVHTTDHPFMQKLMLRDGITTQMDLRTGAHPVDEYCDYMDGESQANDGAAVDALAVREQTFNPKTDSATGIIVTHILGTQ